MTATSSYPADIRAQPAALQQLLDAGLSSDVRALLSDLKSFDRIVMTGMGASLFAHHPTFLRLAASGLPVWTLETSELLGPAAGLLTRGTLLWITSQSGDSGEVAALLEALPSSRPRVLGVTNNTASDLAVGADVVLELHSGEELTVGTRSYVNTLAAQALATRIALGEPADTRLLELPGQLETYLEDWDDHVEALGAAVASRTIFIVGRGPSLAAVRTGSLIIKEAAKVPVEGMSTPQFRHGPLELVGPDVTVIHLAGDATDADFNERMFTDVKRVGGHAVWLGSDGAGSNVALPAISLPEALPIAEILPLQLLSVALAERNRVEPGAFRHIDKVTRTL